MLRVAPLSSGMFVTSILGFFLAVFMIKNFTWAFTIATICVIMFIASIISMTYGPVSEHDVYHKKKKE